MSEYKYTKEQVIENLKDALGFIEQGEWQMYESPWKNNKEVQYFMEKKYQNFDQILGSGFFLDTFWGIFGGFVWETFWRMFGGFCFVFLSVFLKK